MNWRHDPRLKQLLEKATLDRLFKNQSIYSSDEVQEMENTLRHVLNKYENNDTFFENIINRDQKHTPENMLTLSKLFTKIGDYRLACEMIWCCASLAVHEFITTRQLKVKLHLLNEKKTFLRALSRKIGNQFAVFEA
ncbi:hypothetical protein GCK72_015048 [Caenorhabditis remanei]|uniref:Uncharacterized protein n=1 Tax=Caenorhabditis remanei TaxID=31234 RepID=A0A6A5GVL9_CAERE|nr:hypothetical protein GCK72_015048 [Caenorhabditis remanei]KAF1758589.1 hypothetical protein GCK72_015048 [Caenorhabditis remanei]